MNTRKPSWQMNNGMDALRARLEEAESTLDAIRQGDVDALVISGPDGDRVFTLRTADQSYRTIVETMNEGAATISADGLVLYSNRRLAAMLRTIPERLAGQSLVALVTAPERPTCEDLLRNALSAPCHSESVLSAADGSTVPVLLSASAAMLENVPSICLVVTDLTDQKRNQEIVASEKLARSILEQAGEAIAVCDAFGRIMRVNEAARRLSASAHIGAPFDEAFPLRVDGGSRFAMAAVLEGQRTTNVEAQLGDDAIVLVNASPLRNAEDQCIGGVVTLTDITERKRAEDTLRQQSEALARSNADLERFAFAASHDLQEPLRMIVTYAQLLTRMYRDVPGESPQQFVSYIEMGVERMRTLIRDLLEYSRVIHEPAKDFHPADLNTALSMALANLEALISECGAQVTHERLPAVHGDEAQLSHVLQNLIANAIKYCKGRRPEVHISTVTGAAQHTVCVRDNGIGIAPQYRSQIFGSFKRLHGKDVPGSGIGLAVCKRIVELHGGRIWVESAEGEGSTFCFTLPVAQTV